MVSAEPFSHGTGTLQCLQKEMATYTDLCACGETQTMSHIVESCPLTKLNGCLSRLHSADEDAVLWPVMVHDTHTRRRRPLLSRFTSSSTCQPISLIIPAHPSLLHFFTPGSKPTFSTNPSHLRLLYLQDYLMIMGLDQTYHAHHFIFSFTFSSIFCLFRV